MIADCSSHVHAGVSSDAETGCTSEGWTSEVYQRIFLAAQDAAIWQGANRFVAYSSPVDQHPTLNLALSRASARHLPSAAYAVCSGHVLRDTHSKQSSKSW